MRPNGAALSELLSPYLVQEFLREYWGRTPLYIPGRAGKFAQLEFDLRALESLITEGKRSGRFQVRFVGRDNRLKPCPEPPAQYSWRDGDLTICADWVSDCFEPLASYCAAIKASLNMPGSVFMTCYASPSGHGLGTHFDCHPSFVLQLEGSKLWRFSAKPAVHWPPANIMNARIVPEMMERYPWLEVTYPDKDAETAFIEHELKSGDALFLPAGTWHQARALEYSVALTMTYIPMTAPDLVADVLRGHLSHSTDWRCDIPPVPIEDAPPNRLPVILERFFEARLSELREHVQSLTARDLYETWTHYVHSFDTPFTMRPAQGAAEVQEADTLTLVHSLPLHYLVNREDRIVSVYYLDNRLDLRLEVLPLVKAMLAHQSFPAHQATEWLGERFAWPEVKSVLEEFVQAGILCISDTTNECHARGITDRN